VLDFLEARARLHDVVLGLLGHLHHGGAMLGFVGCLHAVCLARYRDVVGHVKFVAELRLDISELFVGFDGTLRNGLAALLALLDPHALRLQRDIFVSPGSCALGGGGALSPCMQRNA
jgi:hypothetical protein